MRPARITKIGMRNYKSFGPTYQELDLRPLTVLIGRNSSGKSTLMQALLLLKQTLQHPRQEVQLYLEGPYVESLTLRELAHGWPEKNAAEGWPVITVEWDVPVQTRYTFEKKKDRVQILHRTKPANTRQQSRIEVCFTEHNQRIFASSIRLDAWLNGSSKRTNLPYLQFMTKGDGWYKIESDASLDWPKQVESQSLSHFIPKFLSMFGRSQNREFEIIVAHYEQPMRALVGLLQNLHYLGATRKIPQNIYTAASSPLDDVGISGEYAAQLLHQRHTEQILTLPFVQLPEEGAIRLPRALGLHEQPLLEAVNQVMTELGVRARFSLHEIQDVHFRLLCGQASVQHVGRGIGYLLPVVVAGLIGGGQGTGRTPPLLLEEVDMHTHPKVQSRLAHFFVSLAFAGRQVMVETHSDHMVRRLRRLIARAAPGSEDEQWLMKNVNLVLVEQDERGVTSLKQSSLQPEGDIREYWPSDFLDEAPDEERAIYFAAAQKAETGTPAGPPLDVVHDPADEDETIE